MCGVGGVGVQGHVGMWHVTCGVWRVAWGMWYVVRGVGCVVSGAWRGVCGMCCVVRGVTWRARSSASYRQRSAAAAASFRALLPLVRRKMSSLAWAVKKGGWGAWM